MKEMSDGRVAISDDSLGLVMLKSWDSLSKLEIVETMKSKDSDVEQLRRAYLRLSKRHHPDRGGDAEMFALINEAYHALADRARRARYATSNSCYGEHAAARLLPLRDG